MRHKIKGRKLNRTSSHRKALLINLACALLKHGLIKTTLPKAKELRPFVEKIMTTSKIDSLANRRMVYSVIKDKELVAKLFSTISLSIKDRNGGYTRIMHYGFRTGDKAPMALIELVDREIEKKPEENKKSVAFPKKTVAKSADSKSEKKDTIKKPAVKKDSVKKEEVETSTSEVSKDSKTK